MILRMLSRIYCLAIPGAQANAIQGVRKNNADMSQAGTEANRKKRHLGCLTF